VTQDDLLYRFRLRTFAMAGELGNVRAACRAMGIHPSTYYRWKRQLDRHGPEILRPRSGGCRGWPIRPACLSNVPHVVAGRHATAWSGPGASFSHRHVRAFGAGRDLAGSLPDTPDRTGHPTTGPPTAISGTARVLTSAPR
jgi:Helix-turn-helix domain